MKNTVVYLIFALGLFVFSNKVSGQSAASLNKLTIEDYQKMPAQEQAIIKDSLTSALKADTNFIKYNQLQQVNELAFYRRDRSKPITSPHPYPKTPQERIAWYQQEGIRDPELYYQNEIKSNKALFAAIRKYPILGKLDNASKATIIQSATITPPAFYQEMSKAVLGH